MSATDTPPQSRMIPNTFQFPNILTDELMWLLSGNEWKVLTFAVRHILGWDDSRATHQKRISLSMFADGVKSQGWRCYGVGLSDGTIREVLKVLAQFGILVAVENSTNQDGTLYTLVWDERKIKWDALKERANSNIDQQRKRTQKARSKNPKNGGTVGQKGDSPTDTLGDSPTDTLGDSPTDTIKDKTQQTQHIPAYADNEPESVFRESIEPTTKAVEEPKEDTPKRKRTPKQDQTGRIWEFATALAAYHVENPTPDKSYIGTWQTRAEKVAAYRPEATPEQFLTFLREWHSQHRHDKGYIKLGSPDTICRKFGEWLDAQAVEIPTSIADLFPGRTIR